MFTKKARARRDHERRWLTSEERSRIEFRRRLIALLWVATTGALAAAFYLISRL